MPLSIASTYIIFVSRYTITSYDDTESRKNENGLHIHKKKMDAKHSQWFDLFVPLHFSFTERDRSDKIQNGREQKNQKEIAIEWKRTREKKTRKTEMKICTSIWSTDDGRRNIIIYVHFDEDLDKYGKYVYENWWNRLAKGKANTCNMRTQMCTRKYVDDFISVFGQINIT